jgi:hypothetical protein
MSDGTLGQRVVLLHGRSGCGARSSGLAAAAAAAVTARTAARDRDGQQGDGECSGADQHVVYLLQKPI